MSNFWGAVQTYPSSFQTTFFSSQSSVGFAHEKNESVCGLIRKPINRFRGQSPRYTFPEALQRAAEHRTKQTCLEKVSVSNKSIASPSQTLLPIKKVV